MRSATRLLLTFLLLLALPLQGFAAAAMISCAPSHHGLQTTVTLHDDAAAHAHHQGGDHDPVSTPSHGKHACSACAACCIGGALMPSALRLPGDFSTHLRPLPAPVIPPAFITEGTERPPRHDLA
ncbi:MAG: hypothetical protein H5U27_11830 [Methyloversatilis sp.]|uniref:hypothetical protein n=1 Tax=Methyloversatilis discipulorum TaxID=1119528 RepID=UPI001996A13A|nr:hypothetical protein [Methyloversatilis discipulorum]MBC7207194.1 hypothetical protein [Methyloversatilis sp.]MBT9518330.1 hypothetical protein [Methyloversatilis discipulorum]